MPADLNYTQQDASQIIAANTAEDNTAYMRLAEKLIQQQDAAVSSPSAIRANIPDQGRVLSFQRSVAVDREADLRLRLELAPLKPAAWAAQVGPLACVLVAAALLIGLARAFARRQPQLV
jgi:hypothetical protein